MPSYGCSGSVQSVVFEKRLDAVVELQRLGASDDVTLLLERQRQARDRVSALSQLDAQRTPSVADLKNAIRARLLRSQLEQAREARDLVRLRALERLVLVVVERARVSHCLVVQKEAEEVVAQVVVLGDVLARVVDRVAARPVVQQLRQAADRRNRSQRRRRERQRELRLRNALRRVAQVDQEEQDAQQVGRFDLASQIRLAEANVKARAHAHEETVVEHVQHGRVRLCGVAKQTLLPTRRDELECAHDADLIQRLVVLLGSCRRTQTQTLLRFRPRGRRVGQVLCHNRTCNHQQ
jgi:hypothetical protein